MASLYTLFLYYMYVYIINYVKIKKYNLFSNFCWYRTHIVIFNCYISVTVSDCIENKTTRMSHVRFKSKKNHLYAIQLYIINTTKNYHILGSFQKTIKTFGIFINCTKNAIAIAITIKKNLFKILNKKKTTANTYLHTYNIIFIFFSIFFFKYIISQKNVRFVITFQMHDINFVDIFFFFLRQYLL